MDVRPIGQLSDYQMVLQKGKHRPVVDTDSEAAFCWLLNELDRKYPKKPADMTTMFGYLGDSCLQLQVFGIANILFSDGKYLFVYCSNTLHWITRRAPFGQAHLIDDDISIDFQKETTPNDVVTIIATLPLTSNEQWHKMAPIIICYFMTVKVLPKRVFRLRVPKRNMGTGRSSC